MDTIDKKYDKCSVIEEQYKNKYSKLLSLVNKYQESDMLQKNNNMEVLNNIVENTKELISESEFTKLKNEQANIMREFYDLETIKSGNPYSNNALNFTKNQNDNSDNPLNNRKKAIDIMKNKFEIPTLKSIKVEKQKPQVNSLPNHVNTDSSVCYTCQKCQKCQECQNCEKNKPYCNPNLLGIPAIQIVNVDQYRNNCKQKKYRSSRKTKKTNNTILANEKAMSLTEPTPLHIRDKSTPIKVNEKKMSLTKPTPLHITDKSYQKKKSKPKSKSKQKRIKKKSKKLCKKQEFKMPYNNKTENHRVF